MVVKEMAALSHDPLLPRGVQIEEESFSEPWTTADFQFVAADDRAVNLGLWRGDHLVGYAIAFDEAGELHLASLAIEESYRRRGWGSHLLTQVMANAVKRGCRSCWLEVRESNRPGQELYRKHEFEVTGAKRHFYTCPVEDAVVMERQLASIYREATGRKGGRPESAKWDSAIELRTKRQPGGTNGRSKPQIGT